MEDNGKQVSSYQLDQEILDARGIGMTVEEVAGLPTCKYAERVQALRLADDDLAFLKGLRRRIKNRLASQNSRRRSMEHLRRLTRELRAVRARREHALAERRALLRRRDLARGRCQRLRQYLVQILQDRADPTEVPDIAVERIPKESHCPSKENPIRKVLVTETKTPLLPECFKDQKIERDKNIFECRLEKLVQQSVNHIFKEKVDKKVDKIAIDKVQPKTIDKQPKEKAEKKKVVAKTVFITNEKYHSSNIKSLVISQTDLEGGFNGLGGDFRELAGDFKGLEECGGVLNLSVKQEKRRSHGRKQSAPRRIAYACMDDDGVLDLKIKKEPQ